MVAQVVAGWRDTPAHGERWWPGMRSLYVWLPPGAGPSRTGADQVGVSFSAHRGQTREVGGRVVRRDIPGGTAFVTGPDPISWHDTAQPVEAVEIYLDPAPLGSWRVDPALGVRDAVVLGVASILKRAHVTGVAPTDLEASTLAHRLREHLDVAYGGGRVSGAGARLGPAALARVLRHVEDHLADPLSLDEMAALVALSPYHFARAFRATTGLPPHRFVTMLRLERATHALATTGRSVTEIAAGVGIANVAHFRRLLRRECGLRPADLRTHRKNRPGVPDLADGTLHR